MRSSGQFVILISTIAIIFAIVFFVIGIVTVYKGRAVQTVTFAISVLVAFTPEGLPSVVTLLSVFNLSRFFFAHAHRIGLQIVHCCETHG
jgi:magnesium-transporting ATPase (P-type)